MLGDDAQRRARRDPELEGQTVLGGMLEGMPQCRVRVAVKAGALQLGPQQLGAGTGGFLIQRGENVTLLPALPGTYRVQELLVSSRRLRLRLALQLL